MVSLIIIYVRPFPVKKNATSIIPGEACKVVPQSSKVEDPGWWYTHPSEKYEWVTVGMMTFPIYMESHKIPWFQTTNQL